MKLAYKEGTWFAVPLRSDGFALGVVARATKKGRVLLGYFFGPCRHSIPHVSELSSLCPDEAVLVVRFGDLALINKEWPIIGSSTPWNRRCWQMPSFIRTDDMSGRAWEVTYSDDDPSRVVTETLITNGASDLKRDAVLGAGAVEIVLTRELACQATLI